MTEGVADLDEATFDPSIADGLTLVDFWAAWCAPCHALDPILRDLAAELDDVRVARLDVSDHPGLGERFEIRSLPTLIVFRDGEPVQRLYGAKNQRQLTRSLAEAGSSSAAARATTEAGR